MPVLLVIPLPLQWVTELHRKYAQVDAWVFLEWLQYTSAQEMRPCRDASYEPSLLPPAFLNLCVFTFSKAEL